MTEASLADLWFWVPVHTGSDVGRRGKVRRKSGPFSLGATEINVGEQQNLTDSMDSGFDTLLGVVRGEEMCPLQ